MERGILDASEDPDGDLVKEVYAHFGLCMYLSQVFETGLINILTALKTAESTSPTRQTFDTLYKKHESLTFFKLVKALKKHDILTDELLNDVHRLNTVRNHLAHRFFREHNLDFQTVGGCYQMIEKLKTHQDEFDALDKRVSHLETEVFEKIGISREQFGLMTEQFLGEMLEEARSRYSSNLADKLS